MKKTSKKSTKTPKNTTKKATAPKQTVKPATKKSIKMDKPGKKKNRQTIIIIRN